jgi:hypothetical protein
MTNAGISDLEPYLTAFLPFYLAEKSGILRDGRTCFPVSACGSAGATGTRSSSRKNFPGSARTSRSAQTPRSARTPPSDPDHSKTARALAGSNLWAGGVRTDYHYRQKQHQALKFIFITFYSGIVNSATASCTVLSTT